MFAVGDYIVYGNTGVCTVKAVGTINTPGISKDRLYYTLNPYYTKDSIIYTPVDNEKVIMRSVISREEAMEIIDSMQEIEDLWIPDEKKREVEYQEAFRKSDCREMVRIIKTIFSRKEQRIAAGKKVTASDEKYFRMAEDSLYGEFAISLDMDKDDVKDFILNRVPVAI